mmetsp:Transcript_117112/g.250241  ORF Transcript_117112/g.250241 Transcript_117112/m.250241 type:complete len:232 (-) Transcript_117112:953-1648(-)
MGSTSAVAGCDAVVTSPTPDVTPTEAEAATSVLATSVGTAASGLRTETTSSCHSSWEKSGAPLRMMRTTASFTRSCGTSLGNAIWISSGEMRPHRNKSLTRPRPVFSMLKVVATASATASICSAVKCSNGGCKAGERRCTGTGKSGRLKGTRSNPSQKQCRVHAVLSACAPVSTARAAEIEGTRSARHVSERSLVPSSGGQAPSASKAAVRWASSRAGPSGLKLPPSPAPC